MPEDNAKSLPPLLLLANTYHHGHHADHHHRRHTFSQPSSGIITLIRNRPRELLLTIMGVRMGEANNPFLELFSAAISCCCYFLLSF
jgi:hypothetical protein